ncbi:MAG TPA: hypothetical protein PLL78_01280 [Fimbriimonadaceae bacterium]|nr:hypothetical protein [Fimbriimonadaceae bacterium]HRJ95293.1 hypothetical protein [Fimbriimonadaceae bacterium]
MKLAAVPAAFLAVVFAFGQDRPVTGVVEQFINATPQGDAFVGRNNGTWALLFIDLTPRARLTFGYWEINSRKIKMLDENFLSLSFDKAEVWVGRIRTPFGHNNWDDAWYWGTTFRPLVQTMAIADLRSILRLDTGVSVHANLGPVFLQASAVDATSDRWQVLPEKIDHYVLRTEMAVGDAIVGLNGLVGDRWFAKDAPKAYGLDFRYSLPNIVLRGELLANSKGGKTAGGGYLDAGLKIVGIPKLTILGRYDFNRLPGKTETLELHTLGAKYALTPNIVLMVAYGFGPTNTATADLKGWSSMVMFRYRF